MVSFAPLYGVAVPIQTILPTAPLRAAGIREDSQAALFGVTIGPEMAAGLRSARETAGPSGTMCEPLVSRLRIS